MIYVFRLLFAWSVNFEFGSELLTKFDIVYIISGSKKQSEKIKKFSLLKCFFSICEKDYHNFVSAPIFSQL